MLDLKDNERALVWVEGRFDGVYGEGLRALWTAFHAVRVDVVNWFPQVRNGFIVYPEQVQCPAFQLCPSSCAERSVAQLRLP